MSCRAATRKNHMSISPNDTVGDAMELLRKHKISNLPVVDGDGILVGLFSMKILLKNLLPVSVAMTGDVQMDIKIGAAPGVSKRLINAKSVPVHEVMDRKLNAVKPDAPLWEGVNMLTRHGNPIVVVDENKKLVGIITYSSLVEALEEMQP